MIDFEAWRGPLTRGVEPAEPASFTPRPRADDTIDADELAHSRDDLVVVDARVASRWRGEQNPIDKKPGRVPGARNAPWNEAVTDLPPGELVAYCGSGVTACVVLHRLHLRGAGVAAPAWSFTMTSAAIFCLGGIPLHLSSCGHDERRYDALPPGEHGDLRMRLLVLGVELVLAGVVTLALEAVLAPVRSSRRRRLEAGQPGSTLRGA